MGFIYQGFQNGILTAIRFIFLYIILGELPWDGRTEVGWVVLVFYSLQRGDQGQPLHDTSLYCCLLFHSSLHRQLHVLKVISTLLPNIQWQLVFWIGLTLYRHRMSRCPNQEESCNAKRWICLQRLALNHFLLKAIFSWKEDRCQNVG